MSERMTWGLIWVDTDGQFYVQNSQSLEQALTSERIASGSGLPAMLFSNREFIHRVTHPDEQMVEQACEVMHDAYEQAALGAGWETNPASRKPWADVPEANKATMRAAVIALLGWLDE
jgi:hypothetical protein